jgi:hypothetical protein
MPVTYYKSIGHLALPPRPSDADLTTDVVAISNPSKPMVDLPVFVFEMLDLPELLKNTGDLLLKPKSQTARDAISGMLNDPKVASTFLTWEFGWAPLISDTFKLLNFVSNVEKRMDELRALYRGKGLRRRVQFQTQRAVENTPNLLVQSAGGFSVHADEEISTYRESWGTIRWKPDVPNIPSDRVMLANAIRSANGLYFDIASAWEAMPWSWLIDYFTYIGAHINGNRNNVGAHPGDASIMTHTQTNAYLKLRSHTALNVTSLASLRMDTKVRTIQMVDSSTALARIPFLSGKQWSILSSLAISKKKKIARR